MRFVKHPITILGIAIVVGALAYRGVTVHHQDKDAISSCVTAATFVVLFWYTWETQKLREVAQQQATTSKDQVDAAQDQLKESQRQTENANRPIVIVQFDNPDDGDRDHVRLVFRNIGTAPAFNLEITMAPYHDGHISFAPVSVVQQGSIAHTYLTYRGPTGVPAPIGSTYSAIRTWREDVRKNISCSFQMRYRSADGVSYGTAFHMTDVGGDCNWFALQSYQRDMPFSDLSVATIPNGL